MTITIDQVKAEIQSKDKVRALAALISLQEDLLQDDELSVQVCMPVVITELHSLLTEELGVNPRLMQLRGRQPIAKKRAYLFAQAMINGVNYLK